MKTYVIELSWWNERNRPRLTELACNCQSRRRNPVMRVDCSISLDIYSLRSLYLKHNTSQIFDRECMFSYITPWQHGSRKCNSKTSTTMDQILLLLLIKCLVWDTKNFYPNQCRQERSLSGRSRFFLFWWEYVIWWNMQTDKISIWQSACYKGPTKSLQTLLSSLKCSFFNLLNSIA